MAEFAPYMPPVSASMHGQFASVFTAIGFSLMAYFFAARSQTKSPSIAAELVVAFLSSLFMGLGVLFAFLTVGLWV